MQFLIIIFLIWRIGLFSIAFLGEKILPFAPRFPYSDVYLIPSGLPSWLWSFANFDGVHYLTIAGHGYSAQFTQVFFPLYPLLLGTVSFLLPFANPIIIGLFLSGLFFLLSLFVLVKLMELDYKKDVVVRTVLFLLVFPTSFFFGSIYTESLFLFLVLSSFYLARKKKWTEAAILASFACATRLIGIFLLPALLLEWYSVNKAKISVFRSPLLLIPVGLFSYMLYLQVNFGDFLYFWHAQPVFGAERSGSGIILLPQVFWRYFKIITSVSMQTEAFWIPVLELVSTLGAIIALIAGYFKKIRLSYLLFAALAVLTPTFTGTLSSMPRYVFAAFPIFISLGMIKSRLIRGILLVVFFVLLSLLTILFTRGHWVS